MRQWLVDPKILCRQHLLGEHSELHAFLGTLRKGISVNGYIDKGFLEIHSLESRHSELVEEMLNRAYNHQSPIDLMGINIYERGRVDRKENLIELSRRCKECRDRIKMYL
jgi:hypothetical protein